jgi:2-succinyl-6-hydroxy-2,4-cyclohexadiene-1-carboxylate synthase
MSVGYVVPPAVPSIPRHSGRTPLYLIHGFLGRPSVWQPFLAELGEHGRVVNQTLPGHGPSPWLPESESFDAAVEAMAQTLPLAEPAWIVAYSMGARIGLWLALRYPDLVAGAVLVGCHPGINDDAERAARATDDALSARRLTEHGLQAFVNAWEAQPLFESQRSLPSEVQERHHKRRCDHTVEGVAWALRTLSAGRMTPAWDAVIESHVPLVFVAGELDQKYRALSEEVSTFASSVRCSVVPGAGHDVLLENPAALAAIVRGEITGASLRAQEKP